VLPPTPFIRVRPKAVGDEFVSTEFEGHLYDYESRGGAMLAPTGMEVGWWTEKSIEMYSEGKDRDFEYKFH
jgi:hypothetical protein